MRPKIFVVLSVFAGFIIGGFVVTRYFDIDLSRFRAADKVARPGFVYAQGSQLMLGGQPYFAKGLNVFNSFRYVSRFFTENPNFEVYTPAKFWQEFDDTKIDQEFQYYRNVLDINTVRLFTPSLRRWANEVQYHGWTPWYLDDGSINPIMRDRLLRFIDIADRNGIKVYITLLLHASAIDWECRVSGTWQDCLNQSTGVNTLGSITNGADVRLIEPGGIKEQKYFKYLESLLPYLKDRPGVFGYEVDNETLLNWPFNGLGVSPRRDWYQDNVGSFLFRIVRKIRTLDADHLIGQGEVTGYDTTQQGWWAFPSPEFGLLNDIHNLNNSQLYTTESFVDFLSPHFYNFSMADGADPTAAISTIRARTGKPVILGEFGYDTEDNDPLSAPVHNISRKTYLDKILAMRSSGMVNGYLLWAPMPAVDLPPGGFSKVTVGNGTPALRLSGPPVRTIVGLDFSFTLLSYDASGPFKLRPLPEMQAFIGNKSAQFVSQVVPTTMVAGQTYNASLVFRNNGSVPWLKIGSPGDYGYAYRIKSQNPTDNTIWGINFVPIPRTPIAPGETVTLNFTVTAPSVPGTYNFQWQMNQGLVGWFGDPTPNIAIQVTAGTSPTPTPTISATPTPTPGSLPTFLIDGVLISTRRQLEAFSFTGSGFTPNGSVERWVRMAGTNNNVRLSPNYVVSAQGTVAWSYTAGCTTPPSTSILWLIDVSTGKKSAEVAEIVNQHPNCVQATQTPTPTGGVTPGQYGLREGDLVSAANSADPDIYIINQNGFKRLFLNPVIFSFYGHLGGFQNVKTISSSTRDAFKTSLYFKNCETNDPKVYAVQVTGEDTGVLHWLNLSQEQALQQDPFFNQKIFCINNNEYAWYPKGSEYTSLTQVPEYRR